MGTKNKDKSKTVNDKKLKEAIYSTNSSDKHRED